MDTSPEFPLQWARDSVYTSAFINVKGLHESAAARGEIQLKVFKSRCCLDLGEYHDYWLVPQE